MVDITFSLTSQIAIVTAAFVLKPLYQIIALVIIVIIWRRSEADLVATKFAMIAFVIGENACAVNYLFFDDTSLVLECLHTGGMLVCFGYITYALMAAFDNRIMHFSKRDKKCALLATCGGCYKYENFKCNMRLIFLAIIPATAVLAAIPLTAPIGEHFIKGVVFNQIAVFGHPLINQLIEVRLYPLLALVFLVSSYVVLLLKKENGFDAAKILFAMGMGPLGFSLMRFFLYWGYRENLLWGYAWEEITEFLFIIVLLWIILRVKGKATDQAEKLPHKYPT